MKIHDMTLYHKHWVLELDKIGERAPETIVIIVNGVEREYVEKLK